MKNSLKLKIKTKPMLKLKLKLNQKNQTLILIGAIILGTIFVGIFMLNRKKSNQTKQFQEAQSQEDSETSKTEGLNAQTVTAIITRGVVSSMNKDSIEITDEQTKSTYSIKENTSIISVDKDKKMTKKTLDIVKKGDNVSLMINNVDNSALVIQIGEGAGSVF